MMNLPKWVRELSIRIGGSLIGISFIALIALYGHSELPGSSIFDSKGGIVIGTIVLMEVFFFGAISLIYLTDR